MGIYAQHALEYIDAGIPVFPVNTREKTPAVRGWQRTTMRHSRAWAGTSLGDVDGLGIVMGKPSGITEIDVDATGEAWIGAAIERFGDTPTREPSYRLQGQPIAARDVIHLRSPFGRSPLSLAREGIGLAIVMERHAARLFGRGAKPSGALKFPKGMGEESVKKARAAWRAVHEGDDAGGRTVILYDGAEFQPLQLTSTDAQFLENRKFAIEEIARAFRVPPSMLFHLDRATWSNTEQMGREFLSYCLEPWLVALEGALRMALFTPEERPFWRVHFDRDDLTRADLTTRATAINSLIASRVLNPNEGRAWLDLQPYEGGEKFINPNISEAPNDSE